MNTRLLTTHWQSLPERTIRRLQAAKLRRYLREERDRGASALRSPGLPRGGTMTGQAVVLAAFGGTDQLHLENVEIPAPGPGEAAQSRARLKQGKRCTLFYAPTSPWVTIESITVGLCGAVPGGFG